MVWPAHFWNCQTRLYVLQTDWSKDYVNYLGIGVGTCREPEETTTEPLLATTITCCS
jgi:hypothetical protein